MSPGAVKSKMARRLVRICVFLVAAPIVVTVVALACLAYGQMESATQTLNRIHGTAIEDAGRSFRQEGSETVRRSAEQTQQISMQAIRSMSRDMSQRQEQSLHGIAYDFSTLTRDNVQTVLQQSLATDKVALDRVQERMTSVFEASANATQRRGSVHIEKAMLALNDTLMQERASRLAMTVSNHLADDIEFLKLTAQMPGMRDGEAAGQKATLDSLIRRYPQFQLLTVLDAHGRETAMSASDRAVTASDLAVRSNAPYFQRAIHDRVFIGLEAKPSPSGAPMLRIAVPIEMYRGKPVGVLAANISLEDVWDTIRTTRIGRSGFAYIQDERGHPVSPMTPAHGDLLSSSAAIDALNADEALPWRVVVAVPRDEAMEPIRTLNSDISNNTRRAIGEMRVQILGSSRLASRQLQHDAVATQEATDRRTRSRATEVFRRLTDDTARETRAELTRMQRAIESESQQAQRQNDVRMVRTAQASAGLLSQRVHVMSDNASRSAMNRMMLIALIIVVVSCLVGSVVALFTAGRIVRPVVLLAQATRAIASGDLDRRVDENAPDEIGDLAAAFNMMTDSLQKSRTDLDEAESQLVQSAKLASLGTLSAGIAHELNQPVAIIRGLAQQLEADPAVPEEVLADLRIIEGQTSCMIKIIKHLRTFSRASSPEFAEVDVHRVVQECLLLVGEQLRTHDIAVAFELCDGSPIVSGDANELEQVFLNLITNARDALDGRQDAQITIRSEVAGGRLVMEFRDNGPGVPSAVEQHIFDPFFTTKDPGKGTGLGLSISHTIVSKHRGELRVHNDDGAVFSLSLPLNQSSPGELCKAA